VRVPLACTVRGCGEPLSQRGRAYVCPRGHTFDLARSGYVNLLQPQDRKSGAPGDSAAAVGARLRLEQAGVGLTLVREAVARIGARQLPPGAVVVDLGCGTGRALEAVPQGGALARVGIDLSTPAIAHAARHRPGSTWVVANADRTLPLLDRSVDAVLSLHARRNPAEVARVLKPGGVLIVAVPAADDLAELREVVQGSVSAKERASALIAEHDGHFTLLERARVAERANLDRDAVLALLGATYRGARRRSMPAVDGLTAMTVTLASDLCVFERRQAVRLASPGI
jgi:23S rRNA (guanine745-N1)-methyltransferase